MRKEPWLRSDISQLAASGGTAQRQFSDTMDYAVSKIPHKSKPDVLTTIQMALKYIKRYSFVIQQMNIKTIAR